MSLIFSGRLQNIHNMPMSFHWTMISCLFSLLGIVFNLIIYQFLQIQDHTHILLTPLMSNLHHRWIFWHYFGLDFKTLVNHNNEILIVNITIIQPLLLNWTCLIGLLQLSSKHWYSNIIKLEKNWRLIFGKIFCRKSWKKSTIRVRNFN